MKWRRKLAERNGVSISEMLLAVLIMSLLTLAVAAGSGTAMKVYRTEKAYSESRVLANSLLAAMTEELRYASNLTVEGEGASITVSYTSTRYGAGTKMGIEPDSGADYGKLVFMYPGISGGSGGTADRTVYPYADATYAGYRMKPCKNGTPVFEYNEDEAYIELAYDICDGNGDVKATVEGVKIKLLNR